MEFRDPISYWRAIYGVQKQGMDSTRPHISEAIWVCGFLQVSFNHSINIQAGDEDLDGPREVKGAAGSRGSRGSEDGGHQVNKLIKRAEPEGAWTGRDVNKRENILSDTSPANIN